MSDLSERDGLTSTPGGEVVVDPFNRPGGRPLDGEEAAGKKKEEAASGAGSNLGGNELNLSKEELINMDVATGGDGTSFQKMSENGTGQQAGGEGEPYLKTVDASYKSQEDVNKALQEKAKYIVELNAQNNHVNTLMQQQLDSKPGGYTADELAQIATRKPEEAMPLMLEIIRDMQGQITQLPMNMAASMTDDAAVTRNQDAKKFFTNFEMSKGYDINSVAEWAAGMAANGDRRFVGQTPNGKTYWLSSEAPLQALLSMQRETFGEAGMNDLTKASGNKKPDVDLGLKQNAQNVETGNMQGDSVPQKEVDVYRAATDKEYFRSLTKEHQEIVKKLTAAGEKVGEVK